MKIKPILFSTAMVQSILEGRKTQTRRKCDHPIHRNSITNGKGIGHLWNKDTRQWVVGDIELYVNENKDYFETKRRENEPSLNPKSWYESYLLTPKYNIDDILWVRETWRWSDDLEDFCYKANSEKADLSKWKPSIFMPKEAARIFLKITNVRVERLQDISVNDAIAEGVNPLLMSGLQLATQGQLYQNYLDKDKLFNDGLPPYWSFNSLWCKINGADSWESNPWVWVYEFEKVEKPANFLGESKEVVNA